MVDFDTRPIIRGLAPMMTQTLVSNVGKIIMKEGPIYGIIGGSTLPPATNKTTLSIGHIIT